MVQYLETVWISFGSDIPDMLRGTCGSVVYDEKDEVVGFFHLATSDGQAECIVAQYAMDDGLTLDPIK